MQKQVVKMYIPRILSGVTQKMLTHTFDRLSIGDVYYIDMHRKVNENNNVYYFAFLEIELYNTPAAKRVLADLNQKSSINLVYDEEAGYYWEIKKHVPKTERTSKSSILPVTHEIYMSVAKAIGYVEEPREEVLDDFDYEANLQTNAFNMWDAKYDFWHPPFLPVKL
jgi:hypothetical protein